jgi:hypothetical protein
MYTDSIVTPVELQVATALEFVMYAVRNVLVLLISVDEVLISAVVAGPVSWTVADKQAPVAVAR